jgi:hypothetical protein
MRIIIKGSNEQDNQYQQQPSYQPRPLIDYWLPGQIDLQLSKFPAAHKKKLAENYIKYQTMIDSIHNQNAVM